MVETSLTCTHHGVKPKLGRRRTMPFETDCIVSGCAFHDQVNKAYVSIWGEIRVRVSGETKSVLSYY
jgi:hypothetical protein